MATLKVQCCGVLEQVCGGSERAIEVERVPLRVDEVLTRIGADMPGAREYLPHVACAIGDEIVGRQHVLEAGQTLVLLPPVSGG